MDRNWTIDPFRTTDALVITDKLNDIIVELSKYLEGVNGKYNPNLGLIIMGGVGTGKSLLMSSVRSTINWLTRKETNWSGCHWLTARQIATFFRRSDWAGITNIETVDNLFIDDVGTENPYLLVYGNKEYPISEVLYARHENKKRTFFTTNLDWQGIKELYDDQDGRIMDRIKSNSNVIILDGNSWRQ